MLCCRIKKLPAKEAGSFKVLLVTSSASISRLAALFNGTPSLASPVFKDIVGLKLKAGGIRPTGSVQDIDSA